MIAGIVCTCSIFIIDGACLNGPHYGARRTPIEILEQTADLMYNQEGMRNHSQGTKAHQTADPKFCSKRHLYLPQKDNWHTGQSQISHYCNDFTNN